MASIRTILLASALVRILLILYGRYHDANHPVKYTDIDYQVFSEAATFVSRGGSPYQSLTYRYTPILAILLVPNVIWHGLWGKIVFCCFDLLTGYLSYAILRHDDWSSQVAAKAACLWLFNPVTCAVSTRGNAEAVVSALVLAVLLCVKKGRLRLAGALYGLAVHTKIYPVVYSLPLYLYLGSRPSIETNSFYERLKDFVKRLIPNEKRWIFVLYSAASFVSVTTLFYAMYGYPFLHQTYLYHVSRKDIRHNFSLYYLMFYLMAESRRWLPVLSLMAFVPQSALLLKTSFTFFRHLELAFFVNTAVFVTFNKVVTSQYFLWYLCLLPVLAPYLSIAKSEVAVLVLLWAGNQGAWLLAAYQLEFLGKSTYIYVFLAAVAFFLTNCHVVRRIIKSYVPKTPDHTKLSRSGVKCD